MADNYDFSSICESGQTLYYKITSNEDIYAVEVVYPYGAICEQGDYYYGIYTKPSGNLIIPESVIYNDITYPVTSIGGAAFYDCTELTSVIIGNSVTNIWDFAFAGCSGLTLITISNSCESIYGSAFLNCNGLTSVTVPNSVTSIGCRAFSGCNSLEEISIPFVGSRLSDTMPSNYSYDPCFGYIFGPESYTGGTSVTQYNNTIYYVPSSLRSVIVTGGNLPNNAFENCSMLTSITIPNTVTSIGNYAFKNCSGLTEITIPTSVTSIDRTAFYGCIRINTLNFNAINCTSVGVYYDDYQGFSNCSSLTTLNIGDSVLNIPAYAFYGCRGITSVTIPSSVTSIGERAFYNCSGLTEVVFNATNCTSGGFGSDCTSLRTLTIGENVTNIPEYAFTSCSGLLEVNYNAINCASTGISYNTNITTLNIGENVSYIPDNAFVGCSGLTSVYYMGDIAQWCEITFDDQPLLYAHNLFINNNLVIDLVIPESVIEIKPSAFSGATCLASVTIPNSVMNIGNSAFVNCSGLTSIVIPNSVVSIGNDAFYDCIGLTELYIGNSVTRIGELAFYGCSALSSVTIPSSVISIGNNAFHNCSGIESISICNGVEVIGDHAFKNCSGLTSVTIPNSVISIGDGALSGCSGIVEITIPFVGGSASASTISETTCFGYIFGKLNYMGSTPIEQYYNSTNDSYITYYIPSNLRIVTVTGGNLLRAFYGCSMLTSITIGENVTNIGECAFWRCIGLTSFTIPNSVTRIGELAFYGCSALSSITIPNSVASIGLNAFLETGWFENQTDGILYLDGWCLGYKGDSPTGTLTIIEGTKAICDIAFGNCDLTTIIIPNSLRSIGEYTFTSCSGCNSIDTIYSFAENPPSIKSNTFSGVSLSIPIFVPCGKVSTYSNAEYWRIFTHIQENTDCAGVEENGIANMEVYPNPVGNILNISSSETISEIEIVNTLGQVVKRIEVNADNAVCDVENLKAGVYVVRIRTLRQAQGAVLRKFVKE